MIPTFVTSLYLPLFSSMRPLFSPGQSMVSYALSYLFLPPKLCSQAFPICHIHSFFSYANLFHFLRCDVLNCVKLAKLELHFPGSHFRLELTWEFWEFEVPIRWETKNKTQRFWQIQTCSHSPLLCDQPFFPIAGPDDQLPSPPPDAESTIFHWEQ